MNPTLAPRHPKCTICKSVAMIEDVTIRLYDENLDHLPVTGAREYVQSVGLAGNRRQLDQRLRAHRKHVDRFIARGGIITPAQIEGGVTRLQSPTGPVRWLDVNQQGMDIGDAANAVLLRRLLDGQMEDRDVISAAKLGQSAAAKRAELEMKGSLKRAEQIARLASGFGPAAETA